MPPQFARYTADWPEEDRAAFLEFVCSVDESALDDPEKLAALEHCWRLWATV